ncbi:uncharacterized protein [Panulirus ornatus]|uniref:uncharacterized protein n=1 Tax=Panulirus ornatus TaxID=150431 RepID=UPI003A83E4AD
MLEVGVVVLMGVVRACVEGHGRLVDPPARSTMWRLGFDTPVHYNDHQLYCGGFKRQWVQNRGRCGVCGDPWDLPRPRPHEAGGTWGTGVISRVYREGQVMVATVHLTTNHLGWFEFRLCPNNEPGSFVRQKCLNKHVLSLVHQPGTRYYLKQSQTGLFRIPLQLPPGLTCSQCVVQWHYTTGNNWGFCKDGRNQAGCGPQEVFRGCSDIAIFGREDPAYDQYLNLTADPDLSMFLHLKEGEVGDPTREEEEEHHHGLRRGHTNGFVDPFDQSEGGDVNDRFDHILHAGRETLARPLSTRPAGEPAMTTTQHRHTHPDTTSSPSITLFDRLHLNDHRRDKNDLPSPHDHPLLNPRPPSPTTTSPSRRSSPRRSPRRTSSQLCASADGGTYPPP